MNVLPSGVVPPTTDGAGLGAVLDALKPPPPLSWTDIFSPVDMGVWRRALEPGDQAP